MVGINKVMSDIIKNAFENIDPEAEKRLDEKLKNGSESFGLYHVSSSFYCKDKSILNVDKCKKICDYCKKFENES